MNSVCSIDWNFCSINRSGEGDYPGVSVYFDRYSIPVRSIETCENWISAEFSDNCSEHLKMFQALWTVLWNILTLYMYLLKGYNPMGINRGLCSLENSEHK